MKADIFDDMTKAIATSTTRRQTLKRIAGVLGGTALAGLFPGLALADNSGCAHFCDSVFDPGPARGQCKNDAAHGTGLCYSCGPASPGGTKPICCPTNPDGTCTSYSSATCCSSAQTCNNGTCVAACAGVVLSNGTCASPCFTGMYGACTGLCGAAPFGCMPDVSGSFYCSQGGTVGSCHTDSDCSNGYFCYASPVFGPECTPAC